MQRLGVSGAVRPIYGSLGVKRLRKHDHTNIKFTFCLRIIELTKHFILRYHSFA